MIKCEFAWSSGLIVQREPTEGELCLSMKLVGPPFVSPVSFKIQQDNPQTKKPRSPRQVITVGYATRDLAQASTFACSQVSLLPLRCGVCAAYSESWDQVGAGAALTRQRKGTLAYLTRFHSMRAQVVYK